MTLEYAPKGLVGVLTPQANTTVEAEMVAMTPPGFAVVNARLKSAKPTIHERLVDYFDHYGDALAEFANAPLAAAGYACTGASYLAGAEREDATLATLEAKAGIPVVTAATAVRDALRAIGADRIALVSPYDQTLDDASAAYWTARGFRVVERFSAYEESTAFHPIYSLPSDTTRHGLARMADVDADAILVLGTGLPSLVPIAQTPRLGGKPVLSCMLCIGWRLFAAAGKTPADGGSLLAFLDDAGWRDRLARMRGA
jgi:maleate cis-trans isomerase